MVTHDPVAAAYADDVVFLADGRIVDDARPPDRRRGARPHQGPGGLTMLTLTVRSLRAHKRRLIGTFLAVFLGVAFLAGTLVLGDTLDRNFDNLFADANAGTDVVVRSAVDIRAERPAERPGPDRPPRWSTRCAAVDGVAAAEPSIEGFGQLDRQRRRRHRRQRAADARRQLDRRPRPQPVQARRGPGARGPPTRSWSTAARPRTGDLALGDTVTVQTPDPVQVTIVGIVDVRRRRRPRRRRRSPPSPTRRPSGT